MIIDQLPLLGGDVQGTDEFPIERGTTTYKTTQAALIKAATDAAAAAQEAADNAQDTADEALALGIAGASVGDLVRVNAVDSNGKPTSWKHVPLCEITTNTNLLDNWYFPNPVNQRGQSSYSNTDAYTIDRWKLTSGSVTVASGGITLNGTIVQILPASIGLPVVASALLSDGSMITPTYNDSTKTFTLTATGQTIVAAKLELGSEQTLAHQEGGSWVLNEIPDFWSEFAVCQRYFTRISGQYAVISTGVCYNENRACCTMQAPVIAPNANIVFSGSLYLAYLNHEGSNTQLIPTVSIEKFNGFLRIIGSGLSGLVGGQACQMQIRDTSTYIDISAE